MIELRELMKKETSAWDFFVPSLSDLQFIKDIETSLDFAYWEDCE